MDYKEKIIRIANDILENRIGIIKGARELDRFQFEYNLENNKSLLFFVGISSETDHLPVGEERVKWSKDTLLEKDKEIKEIEDYYRNSALLACKELIKFLKGDGGL